MMTVQCILKNYQGLISQESPKIVGLFPLGSFVISSRCRHKEYSNFTGLESSYSIFLVFSIYNKYFTYFFNFLV